MEPQSGVRTWQWVVTVIVIIALVVIGVLVFGNKGSQTSATGNEENTATSTETTALNRIVMTDQYPGNVVYVTSVQAQNPSWVVIQTNDSGQPGTVIGSAHFDAGMNPGTKITLSKALLDGQTYYTVLYTDDGSGKFNATTDVPVKDANGNVVLKLFNATTAAGAGLKG